MKKYLETAVKIFIYATFFVPIIVLPSSFIFPFIVPKILIFRTLVELMLGAYILLLFINKEAYRPRFNALSLAVSAFILSFAISTFVGTDAYHSFWDNHERMLGLFTLLHYFVYFVICSAMFKTWTDWKWALRIFLFAGSIVMFVGILQVGDPSLLLNQGAARVASTLGNAIYVGGYGLFLIFVSAILFVREKSPVWQWLEAGLAIFALLGLFYSGTRGSLLGFLVGGGVALVVYSIVLKEYPKFRRSLWGIIVGIILLVGAAYQYRATDFVKNIPAVGQAVNTSLAYITGSPRWIAWQIAYKSWKQYPVFGWGPNNFFYAFNAYYNPISLNFGYGETWFDNAHNIIMNTLAVQGLVGLISYLSIFAVGVGILYLAYRKRGLNLHIFIIGSAFLIAHLTANVTVFENPTSYLYFMFWLAMCVSLSAKPLESKEQTKQNNSQQLAINNYPIDKKISSGLIAALGIISFIFIFIFNIQPGRANNMTLKAMRALNSSPINGVAAAEAALAFNSPHIDDIRNDLARSSAGVLANSQDKLGPQKSAELYGAVHDALVANLFLHPLDIRIHLSLAQILQAEAQRVNDVRYIAEAEGYMEKALVNSPRRQQIIYSLAGIKLQLGKAAEAVKLLEGAISDNPKIGESYWRLAYVYQITGQVSKAKEVVDLGIQNGVVFTQAEQDTIKQIMAIVPASAAGIKR